MEEYISGLATAWPKDDKCAPQDVYFNPPRKLKYNTKWLLLWQESSEVGVSVMEQAKMERPLTQTEYRVRDFILGTIGIGNYVYINQAEVGRELRLHRSHVSKAIKRLVDLNILICGPKSGKSNTYMVNPAFCFSGNLRNGIKERMNVIQESKAKIIDFKDKQ